MQGVFYEKIIVWLVPAVLVALGAGVFATCENGLYGEDSPVTSLSEKPIPEVKNKEALKIALEGTVKEFAITVSLNTNYDIVVTRDKVITIPAGVVVTLNSLIAKANITIIGPEDGISASIRAAAIAKNGGGSDNDSGVVLIKNLFEVDEAKNFNLLKNVKLGFYPEVTAADAIVDGALSAEIEDSILWIDSGAGGTHTFSGEGSVKTSGGAGQTAAAGASISGKETESLPFKVPGSSGGSGGSGGGTGDDGYNLDEDEDDDVPYTATKATSITLNESTLTLDSDATAQLTATVGPAEAAAAGVIWSSSKPAVAAVDKTGLVTALSNGNAVIWAKSVPAVRRHTAM